ncbi:hypothetical protein BDM02DRAFT_3260069 [Thelephora ganbajun]|uniref:Uncharacterized protein n=1 Tax=Thelephora ganbajun TaxID=370292 RepID=A0ACB6ZKK4_THEGA|nr:hypothetical protein BDM02DRAFT_3260069 [Thelephora ganbajun]
MGDLGEDIHRAASDQRHPRVCFQLKHKGRLLGVDTPDYPTKLDKVFGDREPKTRFERPDVRYATFETRGRMHFVDLDKLFPLVLSNAVARTQPGYVNASKLAIDGNYRRFLLAGGNTLGREGGTNRFAAWRCSSTEAEVIDGLRVEKESRKWAVVRRLVLTLDVIIYTLVREDGFDGLDLRIGPCRFEQQLVPLGIGVVV